LVIFTNDNGGEWLSRNAPLYHRKATKAASVCRSFCAGPTGCRWGKQLIKWRSRWT
jgi:hypothetical protein